MAAPIYGWRSGNSFELLMDGNRFFPRILAAMQQAHTSIDIEMYLVESGHTTNQVIEILLRAVERGVHVRCRFDSIGSADFNEADRQQLLEGGVELRFYNPLQWLGGRANLRRDHRKLIIVDQTYVYIGGAGFTNNFCMPDDKGDCLWHEQMLEVQGPVVQDWLSLFEYQWNIDQRREIGKLPRLKRVKIPPHPEHGDGWARVSLTDGRTHREMVQALLASIARAKRKVWLATPYFAPTWRIRRALRRAARRGVDVRLLLCGEVTDHPAVRYAGQRYYRRLLASGVRIFEYQPRFTHLKSVVVDDWISLGSSNFDHWTLHWNLEANQNAIDSELKQAVTDSFATDFEQSTEWTLERWRALPLLHRMRIRLWGSVNRLAMVWLDIKG